MGINIKSIKESDLSWISCKNSVSILLNRINKYYYIFETHSSKQSLTK